MKKIICKKVRDVMTAASLLALPFFSTLMVSCNEWLDVQPESEIEGTQMFSTETGFKDVLSGIYANMASANLYGRELTYGLLDVIGGCYYEAGYNGVYAYALNNDYEQTCVETLINTIWQQGYYTIASINELINQLDHADPSMFAKDNLNVMKGEAIGLRAFLHFDLLRLFAKSYAVDPSSPAIPYVTNYSFHVTPTSTVSETIDYILADLQQAAQLLQSSDPIATGREITVVDDDGYLMNRQFHMNYYAVLATMARVCLYKNDFAQARQYAQQVINSGKFTWTKVDDVVSSSDADRDRTFTSEQVFALQNDDLKDYIAGNIYGDFRIRLNIMIYWISAVFPAGSHSTDWRYVYFFTNDKVNSYGYAYASKKLWQEGMNEKYVNRMPIIRLPEMYLILAESDVEHAATPLNVIREHRGVTVPVTLTTESALQDEITKEYFREYYNEGQLFHRYKRINANQRFGYYNFSKVSFNPDKYVLPMPSEEIEFGGREQNQ